MFSRARFPTARWIPASIAALAVTANSCRQAEPLAPEKPRSPASLTAPEAAARLGRLEATPLSPPQDKRLLSLWANHGTALRCARFWLDHYFPSPLVLDRVSEHLFTAEASRSAIASGTLPPVVPGLQTEGYYAENDGSFQPFVRFVPPAVTRGQRVPLMVFLHGYAPDLDLVNWTGIPRTLLEFAESEGWCLAAPFGRSNTDFQGIGEQDVLRVIDEMRSRYRIDEDRIFLTGISMGGMGTWCIGAHYPDLFCGLVVVSGRGDYYFWQNVDPHTLPSYKRTWVDTEFAYSLASNLEQIPIYCIHGTDDSVIPVEEARRMVARVGPRNPSLTYVEVPNADHWIYEAAYAREDLRAWMKARRRRPLTTFTYRTYHPRYRRIAWVELGDFPPGAGPVTLQTRVEGHFLRLSVTGTDRLTLFNERLPPELRRLSPRGEGAVLNVVPRPLSPEPFSLRGPIPGAFLGPFVFVRAGSVTNEPVQQRFVNAVKAWERYAKASPRTAAETGIRPADLAAYHVFLFGEPEESPLIRQVLASSPIRVTSQRYHVGAHLFPRRDCGLFMVRPSPWSTNRLAIVQCGLAWGERLPDNHRFDFLPDYIIYTRDSDRDGSNTALCAGFFGPQWDLCEIRMYRRGEPLSSDVPP